MIAANNGRAAGNLAITQKVLDADEAARKQYLHTITEGSDGNCGGSYLCTAGTGEYFTYSGPAGLGTPNGIGAF